MEEENEELARRCYEALICRDFGTWRKAIAEDVAYTPVQQFTDSGPPHGREALERFLRSYTEDWLEWNLELLDVTGHGERVLIRARIQAVGEGSGIELKGRIFHVYTVREEQIVKIEDFIDEDEARAAAGMAL
jgi:ketosteroid isomerase-like protein